MPPPQRTLTSRIPAVAGTAGTSGDRPSGRRAELVARGRAVVPGLTVSLLVAVAATALGHLVPMVGGPVFGIVLGTVLAAAIKPGDDLRTGLSFAAKPVLQSSIVVLGATLSLQQIATVGAGSLPVMLGTVIAALLGALLLGRLLGVRGDAQTLIGVGTGICGASAIAATTAVLKPSESQVAYAIGTIFTFNIVAVLAFPGLGHAFGMDPHAFGLWAGTAINDTSSVVAAAFSYGGDAGPHAVVVKLTRTLTLIPIVVALAVWKARRDALGAARTVAGGGFRWRSLPWKRLVPVFLIGFVAASVLDTVGVIPMSWHPGLSEVGTFLITVALAGIGSSLRLSDMRRAGARPLLLGALLWILVAATSLGLQAATGSL